MEIKYDMNRGFFIEENGKKLFIIDKDVQSIENLKEVYMKAMERKFDRCLSELFINKIK